MNEGCNKFVGFYWTLPMPSLGFRELPASADEAAKKSRTIRYQRDLARAFVRSQQGTMVDEVVFVEIRSDRGTEAVEPYVERALNACRKHHAQLLYIDFTHGGWRDHQFMQRLIRLRHLTLDSLSLSTGWRPSIWPWHYA